jgi:hypothetical protein
VTGNKASGVQSRSLVQSLFFKCPFKLISGNPSHDCDLPLLPEKRALGVRPGRDENDTLAWRIRVLTIGHVEVPTGDASERRAAAALAAMGP